MSTASVAQITATEVLILAVVDMSSGWRPLLSAG